MLNRRAFLGGSAAALGALACKRGPAILSAQPSITHGVQSGDPDGDRALVWARCSEDARMLVEWDTTDRFANPRRVAGPTVSGDTDRCGIAALAGLPAAQTIFYRIKFEREVDRGASAWATGRLRTPRTDRVRVAWSGDTCGQGYGRNPDWGGLRGFSAIKNADPDVFVNSGDLMYADSPLLAERKLPDGRVWKNITNERVGRPAQELDDFRARYAYNFEDDHMRGCAAEVPVIAQWDDHEVRNDWYPTQRLGDSRYRVKEIDQLAAMSKRALFEWNPIPRGSVHRVVHYGPLLDVFVLDCRTFRTPNSRDMSDSDRMFGAPQVDWMLAELRRSTARWKLIACDQPLSLLIAGGDHVEGFAQNDPGPPLGREREVANLLAELQRAKIKNTVWVTADVHYAAAHHFDPVRAVGGITYDPFWEFIAGPIHAGNFGPNILDPSLGCEVKFQWGMPNPIDADVGPWDGFQSFGMLDVSRDGLVVTLRDIEGHDKFRVELPYSA